MDIYSFIHSKDIEAHCRKIKHEFTPIESAYLIWQSAKYSIEEKHKAYRELIETTENRAFTKESRQYRLHNFLEQYMEVENKLLDIFYDSGDAAAYSTWVYWQDGAYDRESELYATFCDCISAWRDDWDEEDHVVKTYVYKQWLRSRENPKGKQMRAQLLPDGEKISKLLVYNDILSEEEMNLFLLFESFWIYVPVPFQKGDIVYAPWSQIGFCPSDYIPGVLEQICYQDKDEEWIECRKQRADSSDMTAWCYFFVDDGRVYYECMHDYLSLEYYPKELTGKERVLQPISSYMKGEIDAELLLKAHQIILGEERIADLRHYLGVTDEGLRLAGLLKDETE